MSLPPSSNRAFTLIELLATLAIVAALAALLFPSLSRLRDSAISTKCLSQLKADGAAIALYTADNNNHLPINRNPDDEGKASNFYILVGPYILSAPPSGGAAFYRALPIFRCPTLLSTPGAAYIYRYNGIIGGEPATAMSSVQQPGKVPLLWDITGESDSINGYLAHPKAKNYGYTGPTSLSGLAPNHGRYCNVLFVSGHAESVDLSHFENFPWYGKVPDKSGLGSIFDPSYRGQ